MSSTIPSTPPPAPPLGKTWANFFANSMGPPGDLAFQQAYAGTPSPTSTVDEGKLLVAQSHGAVGLLRVADNEWEILHHFSVSPASTGNLKIWAIRGSGRMGYAVQIPDEALAVVTYQTPKAAVLMAADAPEKIATMATTDLEAARHRSLILLPPVLWKPFMSATAKDSQTLFEIARVTFQSFETASATAAGSPTISTAFSHVLSALLPRTPVAFPAIPVTTLFESEEADAWAAGLHDRDLPSVTPGGTPSADSTTTALLLTMGRQTTALETLATKMPTVTPDSSPSKSKDRFAGFPSHLQTMILMASEPIPAGTEDADGNYILTRTEPVASYLELLKATTIGNARSHLHTKLNDELGCAADLPLSTISHVWLGYLKWRQVHQPAAFSVFSCFHTMITAPLAQPGGDESTESVVLALKAVEGTGLSEADLDKVGKITHTVPHTVDDGQKMLGVFGMVLGILFGQSSVPCLAAVGWCEHITTFQTSYNARLLANPTYMIGVLWTFDVALQMFLLSCQRGTPDPSLLNFKDTKTSILMGQFTLSDLPGILTAKLQGVPLPVAPPIPLPPAPPAHYHPAPVPYHPVPPPPPFPPQSNRQSNPQPDPALAVNKKDMNRVMRRATELPRWPGPPTALNPQCQFCLNWHTLGYCTKGPLCPRCETHAPMPRETRNATASKLGEILRPNTKRPRDEGPKPPGR